MLHLSTEDRTTEESNFQIPPEKVFLNYLLITRSMLNVQHLNNIVGKYRVGILAVFFICMFAASIIQSFDLEDLQTSTTKYLICISGMLLAGMVYLWLDIQHKIVFDISEEMVFNKEKKDEHDTIMNNLDQAVLVVFSINNEISYINDFFKEMFLKYSGIEEEKLEDQNVRTHSQEILARKLFKEYVEN